MGLNSLRRWTYTCGLRMQACNSCDHGSRQASSLHASKFIQSLKIYKAPPQGMLLRSAPNNSNYTAQVKTLDIKYL